MRPVYLATLAALWSGCIIQGTETTPFPPGLEPPEDNTAPAPGAEGEYPEEASIVTGTDEIDGQDYVWVHMRGYIHASAAEVWTIMQDPQVVADRRNTDRLDVTYDSEPDYEYSFEIHYFVDRILNVEWDENWRYGAIEGSFEEPLEGAIRFQKTFGTDFIDFIDGSMSVRYIEEGITEIGMVEHVSALQESRSTSEGYARDVFNNVLAVSNGEPLPAY
ncbi:MAG: hypothetical protein KJO07_00675 [Deltaproteobacteria bacterium]|nr:hypothetical protein [Deltaproteobacteria bacterium]